MGNKPVDFYKLFVDNDVLSHLVVETNRYAEQQIIQGIVNDSISKNSILSLWHDTTENEILLFLAVIMWTGLDQKPSIRDYWCNNVLYKSGVPAMIGLSRCRFEALLSNFHFADNENCPENDRLHKINSLIMMMNNKFQEARIADENVCIDETMIPFKGRLSFRQYIPGKRHKYGLKLFKLCIAGGYTYNIKVYGGKSVKPAEQPVANAVVMELMTPLLNEGRTLFTDNYYTSVGLAHQLNDQDTHLVGTLRKHRKYNPRVVTEAKLKKGEMIARQSSTNVVVGKWKDKRDVLFLTTNSVPEMVDIQTKRGKVKKPSTIVQYNAAKSYIDVSDQKGSYASPIRRSIKWYRKIGVELLTNTAVVNAHVAYITTTKNKISITAFREAIVNQIFETIYEQRRNEAGNSDHQQDIVQHTLQEIGKRGRCVKCYKKMSEDNGRQYATKHAKKVGTNCAACPEKFFCMPCFFEYHIVSLKK